MSSITADVTSPDRSPAPGPRAHGSWLRAQRSRLTAHSSRLLPPLVIFGLLVLAWYGFAAYFNLQYLNIHENDVDPTGWAHTSAWHKLIDAWSTSQPTMPTPVQTIGDFLNRLRQGYNPDNGLWVDLLWTGRVAVFGFLLGTAIAIVLAVLFVSSRMLARSLLPYVIVSQTIPVVALVPPIMLTLGLGLRSEVIISAYLAFFSITISAYKGLQSVEPLAFELMRSYAARPWQVFLKLRLPAALPFICTGMKVGVTASLVGAIIAELPSGSAHGLGQSLVQASEYTDNIWLWSTMLSAACLGLVLYGAVVLLERLIVRWRVEEAAA
jgi:NitT/TauT family transport system permease protein